MKNRTDDIVRAIFVDGDGKNAVYVESDTKYGHEYSTGDKQAIADAVALGVEVKVRDSNNAKHSMRKFSTGATRNCDKNKNDYEGQEKKDTNPKDAIGIGKVPMSCLSFPVLMEMGLGMMEGGAKYGKFNFRAIGVRSSVYLDACFRHLAAWYEGEDIDSDSGISHLVKAMTTLMVLRDAQMRGKMNDDRPPGTSGFISVLNEKAKKIADSADKNIKHYFTDKRQDSYRE